MDVRALICPSCGGGLDPDARACPQCGTTHATRRCGVCFGLNLVDARNCRRCGKRLPEEDAAHRPERLTCAGCGASMTPRKLDNTLFDECDHCGGLWLCPRTIEVVHREADARARLRPLDLLPSGARAGGFRREVTYRKCPICARMMNRTNYGRRSGVIVDVCRAHGSYFDQGELVRIFEFIETGGLRRAQRLADEERRDSQRERRREAIRIGVMSPESRTFRDGPDAIGALDILTWISDLL